MWCRRREKQETAFSTKPLEAVGYLEDFPEALFSMEAIGNFANYSLYLAHLHMSAPRGMPPNRFPLEARPWIFQCGCCLCSFSPFLSISLHCAFDPDGTLSGWHSLCSDLCFGLCSIWNEGATYCCCLLPHLRLHSSQSKESERTDSPKAPPILCTENK